MPNVSQHELVRTAVAVAVVKWPVSLTAKSGFFIFFDNRQGCPGRSEFDKLGQDDFPFACLWRASPIGKTCEAKLERDTGESRNESGALVAFWGTPFCRPFRQVPDSVASTGSRFWILFVSFDRFQTPFCRLFASTGSRFCTFLLWWEMCQIIRVLLGSSIICLWDVVLQSQSRSYFGPGSVFVTTMRAKIGGRKYFFTRKASILCQKQTLCIIEK